MSAPTQHKRRVAFGGMGPGAPGFARAGFSSKGIARLAARAQSRVWRRSAMVIAFSTYLTVPVLSKLTINAS